MRTCAVQPVQFAGRNIIAHPIAAIFCEPENIRARLPIKTHSITNAMRNYLPVRTIRANTGDGSEYLLLPQAIVTRSANGNVEISIRPKCDEFPAVVCFRGIIFDH